MPRQSRIVIPQMPHHVTQRGNYRMDVFDESKNYRKYCELINEYTDDHGCEIVAYCLMTNHVHFIVIPKKEQSLAKIFNAVHMRYSHYINGKRGVKGHLWQGRFYSCVLDEKHLYRAIRYVEKNPVRAKMVREARGYKWSSARQHMGKDNFGVIELSKKYQYFDNSEWQDYLTEEDEDMDREIRLKTARGIVVGEKEIIKKLEKKLDRSLACLKWGRPKKG